MEKVEVGSKLVEQAGGTMEEIVSSIQRVTDIMSEITAATQEQSAGIEQVNQAISQMDQVTQQNAALVEEATAAAESLQDQAGNLAQVVSVFKLDGNQVSAASAPARVQSVAKNKATALARNASPHSIKVIKSAVRDPMQVARVANASSGKSADWEEF